MNCTQVSGGTDIQTWQRSFGAFGEFGSPAGRVLRQAEPSWITQYGNNIRNVRFRPLPSEAAGWPRWVTRGLTHEDWFDDKHGITLTKRSWGIQYHRHEAVYNYHAIGDKVWWLPGRAYPRPIVSVDEGSRLEAKWFGNGSLWRNGCHETLDASLDTAALCYVRENDLLFVPHWWFHAVCTIDGPNFGCGRLPLRRQALRTRPV